MTRYTAIHYDGADLYIEEPVRQQDLHRTRVDVLGDGLRERDLPADARIVCVDDLPQGCWADYLSPEERAER